MLIEIKIDTGDKWNTEAMAKVLQEAKETVNNALDKCKPLIIENKKFNEAEYYKELNLKVHDNGENSEK